MVAYLLDVELSGQSLYDRSPFIVASIANIILCMYVWN